MGTVSNFKSGETCSYAISDILKYYPSLREDLIMKIGPAVEEYVKDLHLSDSPYSLN
jgi:hypothetical protein